MGTNTDSAGSAIPKVGIFPNAKFDVEHALSIYAYSFNTFAAPFLYDKSFIESTKQSTQSFHIYLIGYLPKMRTNIAYEENGTLCISVTLMGKDVVVRFPIPPGLKLSTDGNEWFMLDQAGERRWIDPTEFASEVNKSAGGIPFTVKYIGQSYGDGGSRNAIDRLLKHETLQQISVKGVPEGSVLQILLLEIQTNNQIFTVFYPKAKDMDTDGKRVRNGLDKLFRTTDAERISLYEAALIRYFLPEFNKEFKNSFPSTNLKVLQDCYKKDFLGLVAEIYIDKLPFRLCSESVKPSVYHAAQYDLHNDADRKMFFSK